MRFSVRFSLVMASGLVLAPFSASAQETSKPTKEATLRKAEGVIIKVEKVGDSDKAGPQQVKITLNTAAVWRDYIRDQASVKGKDSAKDGSNSIATQGQPASTDNTFLIEVGPKARLLTRFRAESDETNEGSRTVEVAEKKVGGASSEDVKTSGSDKKAPKTEVGDLKVGQFIEVEAKEGKAGRVVILKPIKDPEKVTTDAKTSK